MKNKIIKFLKKIFPTSASFTSNGFEVMSEYEIDILRPEKKQKEIEEHLKKNKKI